jgi:hypothetical protein
MDTGEISGKYDKAARGMGVLGRPTDRGRSLEVKVVTDIPCSHRI